jgi:hypothetical protein
VSYGVTDVVSNDVKRDVTNRLYNDVIYVVTDRVKIMCDIMLQVS